MGAFTAELRDLFEEYTLIVYMFGSFNSGFGF
jgi:hypothetical protein